MSLLKKSIAECIGTFVLVFCACGVAAATGGSLVATSLAFGLSLIAMAYSIGRISGCHINPAVSIGVFLKDVLVKTPEDKRFGVKELLSYIGAQVVGAILGGIAIFGIARISGINLIGNACNYAIGYSQNGLTAGGVFGALLLEMVLTFIFVYLILNVTDEKAKCGNFAGLLIGLTLTLVHLLGINFTGTSVNPARSIGTAVAAAIFKGDLEPLAEVYIFILAPLAGGCIAALVFYALHGKEQMKEQAEIK